MARRGWASAKTVAAVRRLARVVPGSALPLAVLIYGDLASPWWGLIGRPLDSQATAALLFSLYAAGAHDAVAGPERDVGPATWLTRASRSTRSSSSSR